MRRLLPWLVASFSASGCGLLLDPSYADYARDAGVTAMDAPRSDGVVMDGRQDTPVVTADQGSRCDTLLACGNASVCALLVPRGGAVSRSDAGTTFSTDGGTRDCGEGRTCSACMTEWEVREGEGVWCFRPFVQFDDPCVGGFEAPPPPRGDSGWSRAPTNLSGTELRYSRPSRIENLLCGDDCRAVGQSSLTYFRTTVFVPPVTGLRLIVDVGDVDDFATVRVYNAARPTGTTPVTFRQGTDLGPSLDPGENVLLVTLFDRCPVERILTGVRLRQDGSGTSSIARCPQ